jgi:L-malate glycosyltransferase
MAVAVNRIAPVQLADAPTGELRVCHIMTADLWAGAEVQVATVAAYLLEQPNVKLTAVLFNEGWLASEMRRLGAAVAVVDEKRHSAFQIVTFLIRHLREHAVEVVHTHRYKDTVLGSVAAKLAGVPHVIRTVHGLSEALRGWPYVKFRAYDALDKAALWCFADRIVAVSARLAENLERQWYRAGAVTCIHNGIDLRAVKARRSSTEVRRTLGIGPDDLLIGTAGRLSRVKGHIHLVRAAKLILRQEPRARFLFVGSGPLRDELVAAAEGAGVNRACMFIDPLRDSRAGIYDLLAAMDVFVLPSLDEGTPMALLEAMSLGRPAVATAVGGVPEIISHRETGLMVEPGDDRALADACLALALDRHWARELGEKGRRTIERQFSHDRNGRAVMNLYREIIRAGRSDRWAGRTLLRRLAGLAERRRMTMARRDPAALRALLRSATNILVVCHGNIIRSPFAARLLAQALADRGSVSVSSAGVEAEPGKQPHPTAVLTASPLGIDLRDHVAAPVTHGIVASASVIFAMDVSQLVALRRRFPQARAKTFLLASLCPGAPLEIRDPFGGDASMFKECYEQISRAVDTIVRALSDGAR